MINARRGYSIIFLSFFSIVVFCQTNLVPNPSFETYTNCPNSLDQTSKCLGWSSYRGSTDYYNTCSSVSGINPPYSTFGFQYPQHGNAYVGLINYANTGFDPNGREILGAKLTTTLTIGVKYYFSFYATLSGDLNYTLATNKMGLRFSKTFYSFTNPTPINNFAHYYNPTKITDTLNWVKLTGSFVADSLYQYIMIGNFFDDSNTDTLSTGPFANQFSYYYVDNVCLSTDSNFAYSTSFKSIQDKKTLSIYPNPANNLVVLENFYKNDEYEFLNIMGTSVKKGFCKNDKNEIDVSDLANGLYFVMVRERKMKLLISH